MALSVDSSWHRWQRRVRDRFPQSPSEATPLLLPERETPSCNLAQHRVVFPNNNAFHRDWAKFSRRYSSNRICTTKYTLFTFLPQNLLEQFHRWANLYFLFLVILNWMPTLEVFHREITMLPLAIVLFIIMVKDGVEDFRRYRFDRQINCSNIQIYERKEQSYVQKCWKDVRVGDFIQMQCNEIIPADILLLFSSDPSGVCHLETANLDGETNLKQRRVVKGFSQQGVQFQPEHFHNTIVCEKPNNHLNKFKGYMEHPDQTRTGFGSESLLLRGCTIRNTEVAVGIVIYTGHETKAMLNNSGPRYKRSKIERRMNRDIFSCIGILFLMCLVGAVGHSLWNGTFTEHPPFDVPDAKGNYLPLALGGFYTFLTMIILLQILIPISLYVSIELVKLGQVFFLHNDLDLYDEETDLSIQCRALNITEDLGQIQYIFSDKTGTLTENKMVFRRCTIMGHEYSHQENAKRLETPKELDSDSEEWTQYRCLSFPARRDQGPVTVRGQGGPQPLRRSQSARAPIQGHSRQRSVGRCEISQPSVAFSSSIEKDVTPDKNLLSKVQDAALWLETLSDGRPPKPSLATASSTADFFLALTICNSVMVSTTTEPRQRVTMTPSTKALGTSLEKIQQLFHRLKLSSLSQSFSSTAPSDMDLGESLGANIPTTDSEERDDGSVCSGGYSTDGGYKSSTWEQGDVLGAGPGASLEEVLQAPALSLAGPELCYEAESPDEAALVHAARAYSFTLESRTPEQVTVRLPQGTCLTFDVLCTLEFDSVRKRMSVVVRHPLTGEIIVYTKGADCVIMDLLEDPACVTDTNVEKKMRKIRARTQRHLDLYARDGLRTLCIAKKVLSEEDFRRWASFRREAEASLNNRDELLMETAQHLENQLTLLGATGIEDRLQEGVPDTITALREAGIHLWVLTGDKQETAVNIAYACRLLDQTDTVYSINTESQETCDSILNLALEEVKQFHGPLKPDRKLCGFCLPSATPSPTSGAAAPDAGLVIDGKTLSAIFQGKLEEKFLELSRYCRSVLCCRATPLQKSMLVKLVRGRLGVTTLSIGDGANDVSMIQAADIGIGISGQEGMQAVMSSDFAVSRFRHLKKLLLVHGHWCYSRLARMVVYYFYKNVSYVQKCWKDVRVGDFIQMQCNEIIPADILLLFSSDPSGVCHLETANLDGETNLKQRRVVKGFSQQGVQFQPEHFHNTIVCEKPNNHLNKFKGYMEHPDQTRTGFGSESLLLRGCTIRNTEVAVGIVIYTGHETKAMLNNSGPRYKRSKIERRMNRDIFSCIGILFLMCLVGAVGHSLWNGTFTEHPPFDVPDAKGNYLPLALGGFYTFLTMIILLQILIPISLYVSIELVKLGQVFFLHNDLDLYDEETDLSIQCRALNITEDLGQIQYIFSDKTGTLTENKMVFRRCTIMGHEYSHQENAKRLETPKELDSDSEEWTQYRCLSFPARRDQGPVTVRGQGGPQPLRRSQSARAPIQGHSRQRSVGRCEISQPSVAFSSSIEKDVTPDKNLLSKVQDAALWLETLSDGRPPKPSLATASSTADFFLALTICNSVMVSTTTEPRQRVTMTPSTKALGTSLEKIQQLFHRLKLSSLSQSFSSTAPSDMDLGESLGANIPTTDSEERDDGSVCSGGYSTDGGYKSSTWEQGDVLGAGPGASLEEVLQAPALSLAGPELCYEAESPDEAALVHAARAYSFTLESRTPEQVTVRLPQGTCLTFDVLCTLEFDSVRKRMSVVVRHPLTGEIIVYTKGADCVIMDLLEDPACVTDTNVEKKMRKIRARTQRHLDLYARDGLRTLCIAKKVLSEEDFRRWASFRREAEASLNNRDELLMETAQHLENQLTLLGATGIEDRLQEGVPDTITALREAGIHLWVLTGDKQETAVNIAYACRLLDQTDTVYSINTESQETCDSILNLALEEVKQFHGPLKPDRKLCGFCLPSATPSPTSGAAAPDAGLVIDGKTLSAIFQGKLEEKFLELSRYCRSVLCCRATPLQKSMLVKLVRGRLGVTTLSIGDGANDVSMIQAADIGIGISGQEGMQAVMSSDFAVSRFRHLKKLLLVHGHWCYSRLARMVVYYFYKNVCYVNLLFWYQFFCGFSGSTMIDYWQLIFFNLFFTSLPPLVFGVLDKDISMETLLALPELYKSGQNSECYNLLTFWISMADAFYQSLVCFFIPYLTYKDSDIDVFTFGTPINTISLATILLHQAMEMKTWTFIHGLVLAGSFLMYFVVSLLYNAICVTCNSPTNPYWVMEGQLSDPTFYLVCSLTPAVALLPRYFFLTLQGTYGKSPILRAQKIDKLPMDKRELEIQSWRSHQRPATIPGETQPINRLGSPASDQSTPKNSSPTKQRDKEDWILPGERCSRDHTRDDPYSGDSWAKFSSGEHLLLEPSRMLASGAYSSGQTNLNRPFSRGSHRRSQSSLTI